MLSPVLGLYVHHIATSLQRAIDLVRPTADHAILHFSQGPIISHIILGYLTFI